MNCLEMRPDFGDFAGLPVVLLLAIRPNSQPAMSPRAHSRFLLGTAREKATKCGCPFCLLLLSPSFVSFLCLLPFVSLFSIDNLKTLSLQILSKKGTPIQNQRISVPAPSEGWILGKSLDFLKKTAYICFLAATS